MTATTITPAAADDLDADIAAFLHELATTPVAPEVEAQWAAANAHQEAVTRVRRRINCLLDTITTARLEGDLKLAHDADDALFMAYAELSELMAN